MKTKHFITSILTAGLLALWVAQPVSASEGPKPKISKAEAQKTALAKVPGGKIKDSELEEEDGKLIWSFDIAVKGSKDITEVHVDANTGDVIKVETESAKDEAAEKEKEKAEKKEGKKKGEKDVDEKEEKK
jgi:hypothetical protein